MKTQTVNGVELAFVDQGAGTPVVLVHGFPLDHTMWGDQIGALSEDYRVIAPDLRGFGRSGGTDGTVTMQQLADDLAALLDGLELGQPVVLCGLSMGGYVAFQFWHHHGSRLAGLILCDTRAVTDTPEMAAARLEMAERVLREGPAPLVEGMMPKLFARATAKDRPELVDSLRRVMMDIDPGAIAAVARGMAQRPDMVSRLGEIDCPALVIVGEQDAISTPDEMREIARAMPHARFVEIAGSGHMSPMERPSEVSAAMLEFLGGV
ncbi:MAG: alpha/beta fold hydrolase [Planctomycetota bacterium]